MRSRGVTYYGVVLCLAVIVALFGASSVFAVTSTSNNYQMTESQFGVTSNGQSCSGTYCSRTAMGDTSAGSSTSEGYQAQQGSSVATDAEPTLNVQIVPGQSDLGIFHSTQTSSKMAKVRVLSYRSNGYHVQIMGSAPSYSGYTLSSLSTPTASRVGVEQFGMNVVANTTPSVGANPVRVGGNTDTIIGHASTGYDTPNLYKYKSGDTVAESGSSSGETEFTVSMIVNVSDSTPAGQYTSDLSVVVIPIF